MHLSRLPPNYVPHQGLQTQFLEGYLILILQDTRREEAHDLLQLFVLVLLIIELAPSTQTLGNYYQE